MESRAAANAIRALQERIQALETDKENLENHIGFLLKAYPNESHFEKSPSTLKDSANNEDKYGKLFGDLELLLSRAEFLEKELKRKEQQYQIDKENWGLERKTLIKELTKARSSFKPSQTQKSKPAKTENLKETKSARAIYLKNNENPSKPSEKPSEKSKKTPEARASKSPRSSKGSDQCLAQYEDKIMTLSHLLKESEFKRQETEEVLYKFRKDFNSTLGVLENEVQVLRNSQNAPDLFQEIQDLKRIIQSQNSTIESLTYELEEWKINYNKLKELSQFLKKDEPKFEIQVKPVKELEENVEKLSMKYKELLQRTRKQEENYPELRNELRQTAFDLEYQSFLLYQQRKALGLSVSNLSNN